MEGQVSKGMAMARSGRKYARTLVFDPRHSNRPCQNHSIRQAWCDPSLQLLVSGGNVKALAFGRQLEVSLRPPL